MKQILSIKKLLLGFITAVIPVIIAACYGPVYQLFGMVTDEETGATIDGIQVTCDGDTLNAEITINGMYEFYEQCNEITFKDIDGELNGEYQEQTVFIEQGQTILDVALEPITDEEE